MTSLSHSSKNSRSQELKQGRQQQQLGRQNKKKTIGLNFSKTTTFFSLDMELPNITRPLYGVGEHNTKNFFFPKLRYGTFRFNPREFSQHLPN